MSTLIVYIKIRIFYVFIENRVTITIRITNRVKICNGLQQVKQVKQSARNAFDLKVWCRTLSR